MPPSDNKRNGNLQQGGALISGKSSGDVIIEKRRLEDSKKIFEKGRNSVDTTERDARAAGGLSRQELDRLLSPGQDNPAK